MASLRITACLLLLAVSATGACKSERTCDTLARKNAECADSFVKVAKERARANMADRLDTLPPDSREKAKAKLEERFASSAKDVRETLTSDKFRNECRQSWDDPAKMPPALKKELDRCLQLPDCTAYATCFIESASLSP